VDYEDTEETIRYRHEMNRINKWLATAEIDFDPCVCIDAEHIVTEDRFLLRIFTQGRFDRGGRLFGGFWQRLSKRARLEGIFIEGESVVSLDYSQMAPRILYGRTGVVPPGADAYVIPGFEEWRAGIKKVFNALLFVRQRPSRMPKGVRKSLGPLIRIQDVVAAIERTHAGISQHFYTGVGHWIQYAESQIMVDVLLGLAKEGHVGLPCHDAVVVKSSAVEIARKIMQETFHRHTGVEGLVVEE